MKKSTIKKSTIILLCLLFSGVWTINTNNAWATGCDVSMPITCGVGGICISDCSLVICYPPFPETVQTIEQGIYTVGNCTVDTCGTDPLADSGGTSCVKSGDGKATCSLGLESQKANSDCSVTTTPLPGTATAHCSGITIPSGTCGVTMPAIQKH